jgi:hypothetical protein
MTVVRLTFLILVILAYLSAVIATPVRAQETEGKQAETCPLPEGWDPAEDLPRILAEHQRWREQWPIYIRPRGLSSKRTKNRVQP